MKKKFWTGRLKTILIVALIIAICAAVTLAITNGTSAIENVVGTILSPIRAGVASIDRLAERYYNYMFRYETLEAENAEMEKQILAMQEDIRDAEQLQRENEWLKALLKLSEEHEDYKFLTSYIISWDSSDYKSAFTIGKGTNAGLEEGMCAVTENGQVVGLVTKVGTNWATVTTIMDSSLEISASVASSGYTGVVQGTFLEDGTEILRMNYLLTDAIVKNNDQVVTTGSTLYPRGLLLGYITNASLDETGVAKYATLEPSCDLSKLEQIAIITEYNVQCAGVTQANCCRGGRLGVRAANTFFENLRRIRNISRAGRVAGPYRRPRKMQLDVYMTERRPARCTRPIKMR